jgi:hypothetical protein
MDIDVSGAGVEQERVVAAEDEVEKLLLVVRARGLAEDDKIGVVGLDAELRRAGAFPAAGVPVRGEMARFEGWCGA